MSLIELMVALAIGSLLVLGLVEVFAASRTAYQLSEGLARVQENGRFAVDYLQRDLRMAGHLGCVNDQSRFLPQNDFGTRPALGSTFVANPVAIPRDYATGVDPALRFDVAVEGYEAVGTANSDTLSVTAAPTAAGAATDWSPSLGGLYATLSAEAPPVEGSDILVLRYFAPEGAQMLSFTPGTTATIVVEPTQWGRLTSGETDPGLFGIADCMSAGVFQATAVAPATGTITINGAAGANVSGMDGYQSFVTGQAQVYRAETIVYYVGINAQGNPALYRLRYRLAPGVAALDPDAQELVEGIESLQLQFGQDSFTAATTRPTGNIGASRTADDVRPLADPITAWRRVGMVQFGLVARSIEPAAARQREAGTMRLSALGVLITPPADGRYRTVYEDSVALRNRLFGN